MLDTRRLSCAASRIVSRPSVTRFADRAVGGDDASRMARMCRRTLHIGGRAGGQSCELAWNKGSDSHLLQVMAIHE
jgi:hypothetical protein